MSKLTHYLDLTNPLIIGADVGGRLAVPLIACPEIDEG